MQTNYGNAYGVNVRTIAYSSDHALKTSIVPELRIYRVWDKPIGPHPVAMFEVNIFTPGKPRSCSLLDLVNTRQSNLVPSFPGL